MATLWLVCVLLWTVKAEDRRIDVEYRVLAVGVTSPLAAPARVDWANADGQREYVASAHLPWSWRAHLPSGAALSVAARLAGSGTLRCEVWVNGELYQGFETTGLDASIACNAAYEEHHSP